MFTIAEVYYKCLLLCNVLCFSVGTFQGAISETTTTPTKLEVEVWPRTDDGIISYTSTNHKDYSKYVDDLNELTQARDVYNLKDISSYSLPTHCHVRESFIPFITSYGHLRPKHGYNAAADPLANIIQCSHDKPRPPNSTCHVDTNWGACVKDNLYSYNRNAPCIFLKLKPAVGWAPTPYADLNDVPDAMPEQLRKKIADDYKINMNALKNMWISCEGDAPADIEYMGPIQYLPVANVPNYFFPRHETQYLYPLVAVQFQRPTLGVPIAVTCTVWSKELISTASFHLLLH